MKRSLVLAVAAVALSCTKQQAQSADTLAIDLTNAICGIAEIQPVGQPGVDITCTVLQAVESGAGNVIALLPNPDAGTGTAAAPTPIVVKTIRFHNLPPDVAKAIVAMHAPKSDAGSAK